MGERLAGDTSERRSSRLPTSAPEPRSSGSEVDLTRALAILEAALDQPPDQRAELLLRECAADLDLRRAVESMLEADARQSPLDTTPAGVIGTLEDAVCEIVMPSNLGPFEILGVLGRGGMGVVYEAQQRDPDRRIALKTLNLRVSPSSAAQVRAEAQAMARLLHVGIPQIYEIFEHDGRSVLAMELVCGTALLEFCETLDRRERLQLLIRIAEAVEHAHSRGVIHRDLKPGNILVTASGQPKVLDFGIASIGEGELLRAGTPAYMPPEQRRGEAADERVDVYALAVVAREVLAGPERAERPAEQDLPAALARALLSALDQDPERRLGSVRELRLAWIRFLEEDAVELLIRAAQAESEAIGSLEVRARDDDAAAPARVEAHLAAARFGLEQALTLAPAHAGARRALDLTLYRAAAWRIGRGEIELAAYHLSEAKTPNAELRIELDRARAEQVGRLASARPPSQVALVITVLFAMGGLFLGACVMLGVSPGYGLFGVSSAVLLVLTLVALWRWRALLSALPERKMLARVPLAVVFSVSVVDLGAWLRGWPPEQAHALALPIIACASIMLSLGLDRRFLSFTALHVLLWIVAAAMPQAIYGFLAVSATASALLCLRYAVELRALEAAAGDGLRSDGSIL